jgi:hypothetical protein
MSTSSVFDIPKYYYFEAGNGYVGSLNGMNFKIDNGSELTVYVYRGTKCFNLSEPYLKETFQKSEPEYARMLKWLEDTYSEHTQTEYFTRRISLK